MATAPLEYVAIDILGPLRKTKEGNQYLLVISGRFSKLTCVAPLKSINSYAVARAFVDNWVYKYGPPVLLLSDNGKQFARKYFTAICQILGTINVFTTAYHPQTNGQVERYNRTLVSAIRRYVSEELDDWDQYANALTYAYNSQVHPSIGFSPFEIILTTPPCHMSLENLENIEKSAHPKAKSRSVLMDQTRSLFKCAGENLRKAQERYKKNFDAHVRPNAEQLEPGDFVFVRREAPMKGERNKLASLVTGPHKVLRVLPHRVLIQTNTGYEDDLSLDRVVKATRQPVPGEVRTEVQLSGGDTDDQAAEEFPRADNPDLGSSDMDSTSGNICFVDRLVSYDADKNRYRVRWAGYSEKEDTMEPPSNITFNLILNFHRRRKTRIPLAVAHQFRAQVVGLKESFKPKNFEYVTS